MHRPMPLVHDEIYYNSFIQNSIFVIPLFIEEVPFQTSYTFSYKKFRNCRLYTSVLEYLYIMPSRARRDALKYLLEKEAKLRGQLC